MVLPLPRRGEQAAVSQCFLPEGEVLAPDGRVIASASGVFKPGRPLKG
jgi:hypothetical protein